MDNDVTDRTLTHVKHSFLLPLDMGFRLVNPRNRMAYRLEIAGRVVEMDSAREVYELLREAEKDGVKNIPGALSLTNVETSAAQIQNWNAELFEIYISSMRLHPLQMKAIDVLYNTSDWLEKNAFIKELGVKGGQQLGGTLGGLAKNAKKFSLSPVFEAEHVQLEGKRTNRYRLSLAFRLAGKDYLQMQKDRREYNERMEREWRAEQAERDASD